MFRRHLAFRERRTARGGLRRAFAFEALEGRSLLSGDGLSAGYEPAWTAPVATVLPALEAALPAFEAARDPLFSASPQRLMTAAMWGRLLLPASIDVSTFAFSPIDSTSLDGSPFGSTTFVGLGGRQDRFVWPQYGAAFDPQFESVIVSPPQVGEPFVAKALFVDPASGAGMFCVVVCSSSPTGETSASISVSRFSLADRGGDRFLRFDRALDSLLADDLSVWRVAGLVPYDRKPHDAWIADGIADPDDSSRYLDVVGGETAGNGKLVAGRERPLGGLPGLPPPALGGSTTVSRGGDDGEGYYGGGEEGGFIGLSTMSDFAPSVTNAFTNAVERAAANDFAQFAPSEPLVVRGFEAPPADESGSADSFSEEKSTAAVPATGLGAANTVEAEPRGANAFGRSITRGEGFPAIAESADEPTSAASDSASDSSVADSDAGTDPAAEAPFVDPTAVEESFASALHEVEGEGGLIALAVSQLPSEPISAQPAAEPWFVEDAPPRGLASAELRAFESGVGLFQVFDVAAALPVVAATHEKLDAAPRPTFAMASVFPSLPGLTGGASEQDGAKPADSREGRVDEASLDSNVAIAAVSAVVLSAGLSLRRKGPVAKLRAMFERWPRRIKSRRAKRDA